MTQPHGLVDGRIAQVTGAASGIGPATADALAREGPCVAVADRDGAGAKAAAKDLRGAGHHAIAIMTEDQVAAMVERIRAEFGGLQHTGHGRRAADRRSCCLPRREGKHLPRRLSMV